MAEITLARLCEQLAAAGQRMSRKNSHRALLGMTLQVLEQMATRLGQAEAELTRLRHAEPAIVLTDSGFPHGSTAVTPHARRTRQEEIDLAVRRWQQDALTPHAVGVAEPSQDSVNAHGPARSL